MRYTILMLCIALSLSFTLNNSNINENEENVQGDTGPVSSCLNDTLNFETNNIEWTLIANNSGYTNGGLANQLPNTANQDWWWDSINKGHWISCMTSSTHQSNGTVNQSMTFEYKFKTCIADSLHINFKVFRDNFCNVLLDGVNIFADPISPPMNQNNLNVGSVVDYDFVVQGNNDHTIKFEIIENNVSGYPLNGWGGKMAGAIYSTTGKNSIVMKNTVCDTYNCEYNPSAIATNKKFEYKIYPNPSSNSIIIQTSESELINFEIIDALGKHVLQGTTYPNQPIDLSKLSNGFYYLQIKNADSTIQKIIKL